MILKMRIKALILRYETKFNRAKQDIENYQREDEEFWRAVQKAELYELIVKDLKRLFL